MKDRGVFFGIVLVLLLLNACVPTATDSAAQTSDSALVQALTMNPIGSLASGAVSAVAGAAQLTALANGKTQVVVSLSGLEPNSAHMGHIHVGDCSLVGPVALGLTAVVADASGNGSASSEVTTAQIPADAYIAYHQRGPNDPAGIGSFISCGNIPK